MIADVIFTNGKIYTVDSVRSWAEAVAVKEGKTVYVGSAEGALAWAGEETQVIDLEGRLMLPGFTDAHCHPFLAANFSAGAMLDVESSVEEVLQTIREYIEANPEKDSYAGYGYAEWIFDETGPKKEMLDQICANKPIIIIGSSGHAAWCNSLVFELAGITAETPDPVPGFHYFQRDSQGEPSGCIVETEPLLMVLDKVNPFNMDDMEACLAEISMMYASLGVTSIVDCGKLEFGDIPTYEIYSKAIREGLIKQRITDSVFVIDAESIEMQLEQLKELRRRYNSERYRMGILKIVNDGTVETRSAAFSQPYEEDGSLPQPLFTEEETTKICLEAAANDFDIIIHAIGDQTIHQTLMAAKAVREKGYHKVRITNAHTQYVRPEDLPLFAEYDVVANTTTVWHYGNSEMEGIIGPRADQTFRMKTLLNTGAIMSLGSDFPVDEYGPEPLKGIEMGVTRQMFGQPDSPVLEPADERLTLDDCIAGYTIGAAWQNRNEELLGSVEVGKYADYVVLEENLFETDLYSIHQIPVYMTVVGGEIIYML